MNLTEDNLLSAMAEIRKTFKEQAAKKKMDRPRVILAFGEDAVNRAVSILNATPTR